MMYGQYYGRYERGEWLPERHLCPYCEKEVLEFLISVQTREVIGCTECTTSRIIGEEKYMVDADDAVYLECPQCGALCDTLYAGCKSPEWVDGCDRCMEWVDSYEEEE